MDPPSVRLASVDDGVVVGFATYATHPAHVELEALFVDPDHRRRGHAGRLMDMVVATARRAGVARVEVTANEHASDFYAAAGFVPVGVVELRFGPVPRMHRAI